MLMRILSITASIWLISCTNPLEIIESPMDNFPLAPNLEKYEKPPIIQKIGNEYIVTSQFVYNSVLLKEFSDKIEEWKAQYK